jgi:hypothetical protein
VAVEHRKAHRLQSSLIDAECLEGIEMTIDEKQGDDLTGPLKRTSGYNVFHGPHAALLEESGLISMEHGS